MIFTFILSQLLFIHHYCKYFSLSLSLFSFNKVTIHCYFRFLSPLTSPSSFGHCLNFEWTLDVPFEVVVTSRACKFDKLHSGMLASVLPNFTKSRSLLTLWNAYNCPLQFYKIFDKNSFECHRQQRDEWVGWQEIMNNMWRRIS